MSLLPVETALAQVLKGVEPGLRERRNLDEALGYVLAEDLTAGRDQPPFAASAMDGYAVCCNSELAAGTHLRVIGEAPAGAAFQGEVKPGETVRIFTGAPLPNGTDTIVIQENTTLTDNHITLLEPVRHGAFVRKAGIDFQHGETLLRCGEKLTPRRLGLAAAMNYPAPLVFKRPVVALLATGDELVMPGQVPKADQILSSNSFAVAGLIHQFGASVHDLGIACDNLAEISERINEAAAADILITLGGASVGTHDLVQQALVNCGTKIDFWKIAMRPGKPLMFGKRGEQRILGLPGNPVSALVCAQLFLRPLIAALLGQPPHQPLINARLTAPLPANDQRQDYLRARLETDNAGQFHVTAFTKQDSSMQRLMAQANALVIRAPFAAAAVAGDQVDVMELDF